MQLKIENNLHPFLKVTIFILLAILLASLAFSIRIINSISIILLVASLLFSKRRKYLLLNSFKNLAFISLLILFLIQASGEFYTQNSGVQIKEISEKAGMIGLPFIFFSGLSFTNKTTQRLIAIFSGSLTIVSIYCLIHAYLIYFATSNVNVFFYHDLLKPFDLHAVFFSFYLFFVILYWLESSLYIKRAALFNGLIIGNVIFFLFLIILLSSKLVIVILVLYGLLLLTRVLMRGKTKKLWIGVICTAILITITAIGVSNNPIKRRFIDITNGNDTLFLQNKFSPDLYFNGVQFRLLTWRLTAKILTESKSWVFGVSAGDAQEKLNEQYRLSHIYMGDGITSTGFLNFNCHNVYLQTLLESGIVGLIFLLLFIASTLVQAIKTRNWFALIFFVSMLLFGFSESLISSQYPIQLFLLLPFIALCSFYKNHSYVLRTTDRYFL